MRSMFEANYTITLQKAIEKDPTLLNGIVFSKTAYTTAFKNALIDRFLIYELCTDELDEFKTLLNNRFNLNKEWFERALDKYYEELDETLGYAYSKSSTTENTSNIEDTSTDSTTINDSSTKSINQSSSNTEHTDNLTTNIELPNRATSGEYPSSKIDVDTGRTYSDTGIQNTTQSYDSDASRNGSASRNAEGNENFEETRTGGVNVIDQRERMLKYIKNKYYEFTDYFKSLFIMLYF